jgi:hypothetical protein
MSCVQQGLLESQDESIHRTKKKIKTENAYRLPKLPLIRLESKAGWPSLYIGTQGRFVAVSVDRFFVVGAVRKRISGAFVRVN